MSAVSWPDHLLTLDEWDALPEDDAYRKVELVEGVLHVTPAPASRHQVASGQLLGQLNAALVGAGWFAVQDVEVVIRDDFPPLIRIPDLSVVALEDMRAQPRRYLASQVRLAVEIVSPGSGRTDRIMKIADYAEAGIADYWIIDLDDGVSLDAFHLTDDRYEPVRQAVTGHVVLDAVGSVTLDLDALLP